MEEEKEIKIDYSVLFRILWKEKWWIGGVTAIVLIVGIVYALSAREEFESSGKILPEAQGPSSVSGLSSLVGLAGLNLGSMTAGNDAFRPDLYPEIINSTPFFQALFEARVRTSENEEMAFAAFYEQVMDAGQEPDPKAIERYPVEEKGFIILNKLDEKRVSDLKERIRAVIDKKTAIISISVKMPDPVVAAEVTRFAMDYLMDYIRRYRTGKLRKDADYLSLMVDSARYRYHAAQEKRARYSDQFQSGTIRLQSADVQRSRLESEFQLAQTVYSDLSKKQEEANILLAKETPVFQVLEPPIVPNYRSSPNRKRIAVALLFLGGLLGLAAALVKNGNYRIIFVRT